MTGLAASDIVRPILSIHGCSPHPAPYRIVPMSPTPFFKSTFYASILHHARSTPQDIAVAFGTQEVSYGEFVRDIERATRQLAARLPGSTGMAMVALSHPYLHWVLTIALGRAGLCTVSAAAPDASIGLIKPDLVFVNAHSHRPDSRFIAVDQEWIGIGGDALPPFAEPEHRADAPARLVLSSGTTGRPKKVLLTHAHVQARLQSIAVGSGLPGKQSRTLALVGIDTVGGHHFPLTTWFLGGCTVLRMPNEDPYQAIARKGVNYAFMAPVQLEQLVQSMPATAWPIRDLTVSIAGSSLPRLVSQKARARLSPALLIIYGSTEGGLLSICHAGLADSLPGATGIVRPDVEIEVVDASGQALAHGEVGEVRCRSLGVVTSYHDPEASGADNDETFRDGWFYPGDAGTLSRDGLLSIVGRTQDLINLGGVKIAPGAIEEVLGACPGVMDIAAFALEQDGAVASPWVAVVRGPDYDQEALAAAFAKAFPRLPAISFVHADLIPRNQMGKVQRTVIREQVERALANAR